MRWTWYRSSYYAYIPADNSLADLVPRDEQESADEEREEVQGFLTVVGKEGQLEAGHEDEEEHDTKLDQHTVKAQGQDGVPYYCY